MNCSIAILGDRDRELTNQEKMIVWHFITETTEEIPRKELHINSWGSNTGISKAAFDWAFENDIPISTFFSFQELNDKTPLRLTPSRNVSINPVAEIIHHSFAAIVFHQSEENLHIAQRMRASGKQVFDLTDVWD